MLIWQMKSILVNDFFSISEFDMLDSFKISPFLKFLNHDYILDSVIVGLIGFLMLNIS